MGSGAPANSKIFVDTRQSRKFRDDANSFFLGGVCGAGGFPERFTLFLNRNRNGIGFKFTE